MLFNAAYILSIFSSPGPLPPYLRDDLRERLDYSLSPASQTDLGMFALDPSHHWYVYSPALPNWHTCVA
jgi:hypothetical protein